MLWLLLLACVAEAPPPEPEPARPDILLITIDTLRADRVGCYGDPLASTPAIDALAARGALFREAHAVTPLTLPSHATILTGLLPAHHGLRDNAGFRLSEGVETLAERLSAAGYATGAFVSAFVLDPAWGLDQGFQTYRASFNPQDVAEVGAFGEVELPAAEVVNGALSWWREGDDVRGAPSEGSPPTDADGRRPRFAWVHLYSPHTPWDTHPGWEGDPYRGEVWWADTLVSKLVDAAGDDALIVLTSDHGEGLWDHGEREHGVLIGRAVTRVPLIVRPPGGIDAAPQTDPRPAGAAVARRPPGLDTGLVLDPVPDAPRAAWIVDEPVSSADIASTVLDLVGLPTLGDGRSLRGAVEGGAIEVRPVVAETFFPLFHLGWSNMRMVQGDRYRLERGARDLWTDWTIDPSGAYPTGQQPPSAEAQVAALDAAIGERLVRPGPVDGETAARLAALGYLSAPVEPQADAPDPRDRIDLLAELHTAEALEPAAAIPVLEDLVRRAPDMPDARISLSLARAHDGDLEGALADTRAVLATSPEHPTALSNAGALLLALKRHDEALEIAHRMQAINERDARGWRLDAAVKVAKNDAAGVKAACERGLAAAPEDPNLHYLLALAELQVGDPLRAVDHLEAARLHGTRASDTRLWMGLGYQKAGRIDEAKAAYLDATREIPDDPRPWAMAGVMLYEEGRCDEARPFLINVAKRGASNDPRFREALAACGSQKGIIGVDG